MNKPDNDTPEQKPLQKGNTGTLRVIKAASYSRAGLKAAWHHESAFRQELALVMILTPLAVWLAQNWIHLLLMLLSCMLVLITELLNTAVETVVDRVGVEQNDLAGRAKDIASAAVAMALVLVIMSFGFVALERFYPM